MKLQSGVPDWLKLAVAACPVAGSGVHRWLFSIARQLWPHYDRGAVISIITTSTANCGRVVSDKEISEAVDAAEKHQWCPQERGAFTPKAPRTCTWPEVNTAARTEIIKDGGGLVDLWEASPVRIDSNEPRTEQIIDSLFPGNPLLCCGASSSVFDTRPREDWRNELSKLQLVVPSPMSALTGLTKKGEESAHALSNTGQRRFLVCEFDEGTTDEHAALLLHFASLAPLVLAVSSGGKSLHGWFYCAGQTEDRLRRFMEYAVSLGADHATWTKSQFVRMPDGTRDTGKRQTVYFFNPNPIKS